MKMTSSSQLNQREKWERQDTVGLNQLTTRVKSLHIFQPKIKVTENRSSPKPVASSAAASPTTAMIPTYNKSTNGSNEATSSTSDARHSKPRCQYCWNAKTQRTSKDKDTGFGI